ncbi:MAG TPA: alpha/beta hydrolase, partial [Afipia sp.]|nr:alpha/beta hydrolase [Afipia sp.]
MLYFRLAIRGAACAAAMAASIFLVSVGLASAHTAPHNST